MNKDILKVLQEDLPIAERPFKALAAKIGLTEEQFLAEVKKLQAEGVIRKFGAILKHQKAGFTSNAMVVFDVPAGKVAELGERIASFKEVSHCYERPRFDNFNYNLYAMTHGKSREELVETVERIAQTIEIPSYNILWSKKEYKKASPKYF